MTITLRPHQQRGLDEDYLNQSLTRRKEMNPLIGV